MPLKGFINVEARPLSPHCRHGHVYVTEVLRMIGSTETDCKSYLKLDGPGLLGLHTPVFGWCSVT